MPAGVVAVSGVLVVVNVHFGNPDQAQCDGGQNPRHHDRLDQASTARAAFVAPITAFRVGRSAGLTLPSIDPFHGYCVVVAQLEC